MLQENADQQAADDGADRRVDAAEHGCGEGVDEDGGHHVRVEAHRRSGEHARHGSEEGCENQPSASIHVTRTPTSRASSGLTAAARNARPTFVN